MTNKGGKNDGSAGTNTNPRFLPTFRGRAKRAQNPSHRLPYVFQPFFNALPSATGAPAATTAAGLRSDFGAEAVTVSAAPASPSSPSQDESATTQQPQQQSEEEVASGEPSSATPAADPQPAAGPAQEDPQPAASPAQEEAAAVEASTASNDAAGGQSEPQTEAGTPVVGGEAAAAQESDAQAQSAAEKLSPVVVEEIKETSGAAVPAAAVESTDAEAGKSGEIKDTLPGIKPTEPAVASGEWLADKKHRSDLTSPP